MFRILRHRRLPLPIPHPGAMSDGMRAGLAAGLAAFAVFALGATSRALLSATPVQHIAQSSDTDAVIKISGGYLPTNDWVDQINNPSAWSGGRYRGTRQRPASRDEERREREQEERAAREERQRAEREARDERLRDEREAREETMARAREIGRERGTYRTVCVRLCDGYFFPISFSATPDRFAADEASCNARCSSGARLYVYPNPGGEPEDMRDVRGQPYTALKTAFLFRTTYVEACTCKPHPWEEASLKRHRAYAERADKSRRPVAAKVQPAPRELITSVTPSREDRGPRPIAITGSSNSGTTQTSPMVRATSIQPLPHITAPPVQRPSEASAASPSLVTTDVQPPLASAPPAAEGVSSGPQLLEGAMLLGATEAKPAEPAAPVASKRRIDGPKRERREASAPRRERREITASQNTRSASSSSRPEWATRVFGN